VKDWWSIRWRVRN